MTEPTLLNRLKRYGYGQHHGPMAKACAEAADEIEQLWAALQYARRALTNIAHDSDIESIRSTANVGLGMSVYNQQELKSTERMNRWVDAAKKIITPR